MVIDIKMCRFDNVPWGFRLVGGTDFEYPLTVVKVTEGSIADDAGLRVGDIIVRINDTATSPLTHDETNHIIKRCGNVFYFGIQREDEPENVPKFFPINESEQEPGSFLYLAGRKSPTNVILPEIADRTPPEYISDLAERPCSVLSESSEIKLVEEEIAAVLSGESEVLKEHNVMGIFPKSGVCMTSEVLRTLNEDATKTKAEKDKENKKWTTFLQKPDRPIPKSKEQLEAERRAANAYKVQIIKSAPRTPERSVSPAPRPLTPVPQILEEKVVETMPVGEPETPKPEEDETPPTDNEVPNLEQGITGSSETSSNNVEENNNNSQDENTEKIDKEKEETEEKPLEKDIVAAEEPPLVESPKIATPKTEEELALERQLSDVQKQLAALSSLPSTIQATLDAVTKQLADLMPAFKLTQKEPVKVIESEVREIKLEKIEEKSENLMEDATSNSDHKTEKNETKIEESLEDQQQPENLTKANEEECIQKNEVLVRNEETRQMEEEQTVKKQKRHDVIEELEEHLERKNNPSKRSKRAFGPLTPSSERPLVLPGGRRWYRPKDAYNDEFIAETLSAQAELITGTTLGVNFMKYQKPEKKIDLNRSEVYKVIHHLDRQPVRGIEVRPPVVPAEADIRKIVQF